MPSVRKLVEHLKDLFEEEDLKRALSDQPPKVPAQRAPVPPQRESSRKIRDFASEQADAEGQVLAGSVELVGLSDIRQSLGDRWSLLADKAARIAEQEIRRLLTVDDVCERYDEETFLICFANGDDESARSLAKCMSEAISSRIRAEIQELSEVGATSFVHRVDAEQMAGAVEPFDFLCQSLRQIAAEAALEETNDARPAFAMMRKVPVVFQPMWPTNGFDPTINRCMFEWSYEATHHDDDVPEKRGMAEAIDCVLLTRTVEQIHHSMQARKPAKLLASVHFSTLERPKSRADYLRLASLLPDQYRRHLTLEIHGIPELCRTRAFSLVLNAASQVTDQLVARLPRLQLAADPAIYELLCGLSLEAHRAEPTDLRNLTAWACELEMLSGRMFRTFVSGANSIVKARAALGQRVTYISGPAVYPNMLRPHPSAQPLIVDRHLLGLDRAHA